MTNESISLQQSETAAHQVQHNTAYYIPQLLHMNEADPRLVNRSEQKYGRKGKGVK